MWCDGRVEPLQNTVDSIVLAYLCNRYDGHEVDVNWKLSGRQPLRRQRKCYTVNRFIPVCWLLLCCGLLAGCGKGAPTVAVTGEAVFSNGTHLPDANIEFRLAGLAASYIAHGSIDQEGQFELYTSELGEGALTGDYQAIIIPRVHGGKHAVKIDSIPQKYHSYATTPLKFHIAEDESKNHFHIELDPPKDTGSKTSKTKTTAAVKKKSE